MKDEISANTVDAECAGDDQEFAKSRFSEDPFVRSLISLDLFAKRLIYFVARRRFGNYGPSLKDAISDEFTLGELQQMIHIPRGDGIALMPSALMTLEGAHYAIANNDAFSVRSIVERVDFRPRRPVLDTTVRIDLTAEASARLQLLSEAGCLELTQLDCRQAVAMYELLRGRLPVGQTRTVLTIRPAELRDALPIELSPTQRTVYSSFRQQFLERCQWSMERYTRLKFVTKLPKHIGYGGAFHRDAAPMLIKIFMSPKHVDSTSPDANILPQAKKKEPQ